MGQTSDPNIRQPFLESIATDRRCLDTGCNRTLLDRGLIEHFLGHTVDISDYNIIFAVKNGSGSGSYVAGSQPIIVANDPAKNQQFSSWSIDPANTKIAIGLLLELEFVELPLPVDVFVLLPEPDFAV